MVEWVAVCRCGAKLTELEREQCQRRPRLGRSHSTRESGLSVGAMAYSQNLRRGRLDDRGPEREATPVPDENHRVRLSTKRSSLREVSHTIKNSRSGPTRSGSMALGPAPKPLSRISEKTSLSKCTTRRDSW